LIYHASLIGQAAPKNKGEMLCINQNFTARSRRPPRHRRDATSTGASELTG
jgi:hypothetical protein